MEKGMISVDRWSEESQAYFLTHLHADHTKGLSSNWNKGPVICSPISAKLFPIKFPDFKRSLLRVLEIGVSYSLSVISPSSGSEVAVQVMAIDADHCPGAVMYLFRGYFGCMLYTGDFRWESTSERALSGKCMLLSALGGDKIDTLYLDNTYCNPSYSFPPRDVVARQVIGLIASHPDHDIIIAINTLGKEDLLLHISRALHIKIWVWPERLETMHLLGFHDIFTTKTCLTRVRAVPFYSFSINTLEELNKVRPTIGIMPSGLPWVVRPFNEDTSYGSSPSVINQSKKGVSGSDHVHNIPQNEVSSSVRKFSQYIYSVPYSDHSCFYEIQEFIKLIRPLKIRGIVSSSTCYIDPLYHLGHLCGHTQLTEKASVNSEKNEVDETADAIPAKSALKYNKSVERRLKRERLSQLSCLGVRTSRVRILRRQKCGVRISQATCSD